MSSDTYQLGNWATTLGATISTLTPDGSKFDEISANVFGNERHNAIIQVKLRLGDDKGKEIPKNNPISLTAVKRSITLGNYDDTNGFIALGGGAMTGWKVHDSPSVFLCPPQQSEGPLPTISPSIYKDYVDGGVPPFHRTDRLV